VPARTLLVSFENLAPAKFRAKFRPRGFVNKAIMAGFDDAGVFFSDNIGSEDQQDELNINRQQLKKRFKDFIKQFHEGNFSYIYR
jgi:hypothetical protein